MNNIKQLIETAELKFDKHLKGNLTEIQEMIKQNFDGVILIDGMEGSGKTELAKQICLYSDNTFTANDVFYSTEQFEEWIETAPKGKAGLWDEFVLGGLSSDALTEMQKILIKRFTMIRKKNLIIVLVIPYIFLLRKYFAVARTRALVHVYAKGYDRGYFKFYNYSEKLWIYNYGYKTWLYSPKVNPSFEGKFVAWADNYLDTKLIEQKKDQAIEDLGVEDNIKLTKKQIMAIKEYNCLKNNVPYDIDRNNYEIMRKLLQNIDKFKT